MRRRHRRGLVRQVVADYQMSPEIMMSARGTSGGSGVVGGLLNRVLPGAGAVARQRRHDAAVP